MTMSWQQAGTREWWRPFNSISEAYRMTRWNTKVISPPTDEPFGLVDARLHLRVEAEGSPPSHPDDPLIAALITAAREWCEAYSGLALAPQTVEMGGSAFPTDPVGGYIELSYPPFRRIVSVNYTDTDGTTIVPLDPTLFVVDDVIVPTRIYLVTGKEWPVVASQTPNSIRIRFETGYDFPGDSPQINVIPQSLIAAMKLILGHLYENREETAYLERATIEQLPFAAKVLLDSYRVRLGMA